MGRSFIRSAQSFHLHARPVVRPLQPHSPDKLDYQRTAGAVSQAQAAMGGKRLRLDPVPHAETRPRIHDALVRGTWAKTAAERIHARHALHDTTASTRPIR